jgi:hypothetical protein
MTRRPRPSLRASRSTSSSASHLTLLVRVACVLGIVLATVARSEPARAQQTTPAAVVRALYEYQFAHEQNWVDTFQHRRSLFSGELARLIDADLAAAEADPDEIVGLDFDPLLNAQDVMDGYALGVTRREGADAIVPVSLRSGTTLTGVRIRLGRERGAWKVKNIHYPEGADLAGVLRDLAEGRQHPPGS